MNYSITNMNILIMLCAILKKKCVATWQHHAAWRKIHYPSSPANWQQHALAMKLGL